MEGRRGGWGGWGGWGIITCRKLSRMNSERSLTRVFSSSGKPMIAFTSTWRWVGDGDEAAAQFVWPRVSAS